MHAYVKLAFKQQYQSNSTRTSIDVDKYRNAIQLSIKIERQRAQNRTKAQCKKELINVEIIALFMASKTKKQLTF